MERQAKLFDGIKRKLRRSDFIVKQRRRVQRIFGFDRDCISWRKLLLRFCSEQGIVTLINEKQVLFMRRPSGDLGTALDLAEETLLS